MCHSFHGEVGRQLCLVRLLARFPTAQSPKIITQKSVLQYCLTSSLSVFLDSSYISNQPIVWRPLVYFPAAQPWNNYTETLLIKSLLGPLALTSSYWLTLTSQFNPLPLFYILSWGSWPTSKVPACLSPVVAPWLLSDCLRSPSIQFSFSCLAVL